MSILKKKYTSNMEDKNLLFLYNGIINSNYKPNFDWWSQVRRQERKVTISWNNQSFWANFNLKTWLVELWPPIGIIFSLKMIHKKEEQETNLGNKVIITLLSIFFVCCFHWLIETSNILIQHFYFVTFFFGGDYFRVWHVALSIYGY